MIRNRFQAFRFFLYVVPAAWLCFSGCAGKTNGSASVPPGTVSFESEMKTALQQLDGFSEKERAVGANAIRKSAYFDYLGSLSGDLDPKDGEKCRSYLDVSRKMLTVLQPVVKALFVSSADIYPEVKTTSFESLQQISRSLLTMIHTVYAIRNTHNGSGNATDIYNEAVNVLTNGKRLNEDIITFFRNEAYRGS